MVYTSTFHWVVALGRPFLHALAGHYRGVWIERDPVDADLTKLKTRIQRYSESVTASLLPWLNRANRRMMALKFAMRSNPNTRFKTGS